jgi:chloramphenicol 3-O phosphotransferase
MPRARREASGVNEGQDGKVILLNGTTSSGKSSIARALQSEIDEPFWHFSIDHLRDAGVLPLDRIRRGEFPWTALRDTFFEGFHRSLPAFLGAGNNMIVEHIVETPEWMKLLVTLLDGFDVFFVGVHCPLDELERREVARGDRPVGGTRRDFETIHRHAIYDLELDALIAPSANARIVISAWRQRERPSAFARMGAERGRSEATNQ